MTRKPSCSRVIATLFVLVPLALAPIAEAAQPHRGGGGGGGHARSAAHTSVNRPANRPSPAHGGGGHPNNRNPGNRPPGNRNVNANRNVNVNKNVHVDVDHHGGYDHHDHWNDWDDHYHPIATAAAVTATVAVTSAVIGSIVNDVPSSGCVTSVVNGIAYQQCGSTWYQPQYAGSNVQYIVVNPPR